jgi:hypothetical protein
VATAEEDGLSIFFFVLPIAISEMLGSGLPCKLALASAAFAGAIVFSSSNAANADNILLNGGFEDGVYSVSVPLLGVIHNSIPNSWIANFGYVSQPAFNQVNNANFIPVHSGTFALQIGNFDFQPVPSLSQTFFKRRSAMWRPL